MTSLRHPGTSKGLRSPWPVESSHFVGKSGRDVPTRP